MIAALLCLSIAEVEGTAGLGPIGAMGIAVAMLTMLTLLPALLAIFGRRAFWPPPMFGWSNGVPPTATPGADETHGAWRRIGDRVARCPRRVWIGTTAVLRRWALGVLTIDTGLTQSDAYREIGRVDRGPGAARAVVPGRRQRRDGHHRARPRRRGGGRGRAAEDFEGVAWSAPTGPGDSGVLLNAVLEPDPYSTEAYDLIPDLRAAVKEAGGPDVLVGGPTAIEYDVRGRRRATPS